MIDWETFKMQLQTNPGKVLKSVLLLAGCFTVIWILVVMQSDLGGHKPMPNSGRLDSLKQTTIADSLPSIMPGSRPQPKKNIAPQSGFYSLLPVLLIFLIFIGGIWFWLRSKKSQNHASQGAFFTTVATQQIPGGQQLVIGRLNGEYWVMATGGTQATTLLHRYSAADWEGATEQREPAGNWKRTFKEAMSAASSKSTSSKPENS